MKLLHKFSMGNVALLALFFTLSPLVASADYRLSILEAPASTDPAAVATSVTVIPDGLTEAGLIAINATFPEPVGDRQAGFWSQNDSSIIGTLGGVSSVVNDINEPGHLVGRSSTSDGLEQAFFWSPETGMRALGSSAFSSQALAINEAGQVVGEIEDADGNTRAFSWTAQGGLIELDLLGAQSARAFDVDDTGRVIGILVYDELCLEQVHVFSWSAANGMVDLGDIDGGEFTSITASSDTGYIVGHSIFADGNARAFFFNTNGVTTDLGTLGGVSSHATDVSSDGLVVGYTQNAQGDTRAFLWTRDDGMLDLGHLGGNVSDATALNDAGQIVGRSTDANNVRRAFVWSPATGMVDLNSRIPAGAPAGLVLEEAVDIGEDGSIVAYGRVSDSEAMTWVLLTPETEETALDADADGIADVDDICPGTRLGIEPTVGATKNRFYATAEGFFIDGRRRISSLTIADTRGCSGQQIIELADLGSSNERYGVWEYLLIDWANSVNVDTSDDEDGDGVADAVDICPRTVLGIRPSLGATKNRFYATITGNFIDGRSRISDITVADAGGCSGQQIIALAGLGSSNERYGVWERYLTDWAAFVDGRLSAAR